MPGPSNGRKILLLLSVASCLDCASLPSLSKSQIARCPAEVLPTSAIPGDFFIRQQHRITSDHVDQAFEVVIEKRGDGLIVLGFGTFGAKAFAVTQVGSVVTVEEFMPGLPVPPENVLWDLHRSLLRWRAGLPTRPEEGVSVRADSAGEGQPSTVRIRNEKCDYLSTIVTVEERDS